MSLTALALTSSHAGHEVQCIGVIERLGLTPITHHVKPSSFEKFIAPYGKRNISDIPKTDLIVAAGRQAIAYARSLKTPQNLVCILQDPKCSTKPFDLVWVNNHDKARGENVIRTLTSPHRLNAKRLHDEAMLLPPSQNKVLGVIVGGSSKTHQFTLEDSVELGKKLKSLAQTKGYSIYLTPSRRTGEAQIKALQQELLGHFVWDGINGQNPYFGILGLAHTLIITDDSTNMLSEGTFTGKPIYAYPIRGGSRKFDIFKQDLLNAGVIRIYDDICDDFYYTPLDSTQKIADILQEKLENLKQEKRHHVS